MGLLVFWYFGLLFFCFPGFMVHWFLWLIGLLVYLASWLIGCARFLVYLFLWYSVLYWFIITLISHGFSGFMDYWFIG